MLHEINVASSWQELNKWQLCQIAHQYFISKPETFDDNYRKMIFILFQKKNTILHRIRLYWLINQTSIINLEPFARFLTSDLSYHVFPAIKGLIKPSPRLANITVKQFSIVDSLYHRLEQTKNDLDLRRFVASLYRVKEEFDELDLPAVAKITDKLSQKERELIALAYNFTRMHIWRSFPIVFPKPKKESQINPSFAVNNVYTSFEKIMVGLAMDELQPLGKKQDINNVRIYEFLNVLTESIIRHREKQRLYEKSK